MLKTHVYIMLIQYLRGKMEQQEHLRLIFMVRSVECI